MSISKSKPIDRITVLWAITECGLGFFFMLFNHPLPAIDMESAGLKKGDVLDLWNDHNDIKRCAPRFLVVPCSVPQKCTVTYFPETNVLVPID